MELATGDLAAPTREAEMRAAVVAAARRCFARDGVRKTRMDAIAREAGIVRQTVYTFVESRAHLLELALAERVEELTAEVHRRAIRSGDLVEELVDTLAVMAEVVNTDPECTELEEAMNPVLAFRVWAGRDSALQDPAEAVLKPLYDRAEREGLVRRGLSLGEMTWWVRNALAPLSQRDDLNPAEMRTVIRRFVIPAFLVDGGEPFTAEPPD